MAAATRYAPTESTPALTATTGWVTGSGTAQRISDPNPLAPSALPNWKARTLPCVSPAATSGAGPEVSATAVTAPVIGSVAASRLPSVG